MPVDAASSAPRLFALVPCAGVGARAGAGGPKQYVHIAGSTVVGHTLAALALVRRLDTTLVVLSPEDERFEREVPGFDGLVARVGGDTRAASVRAGLDALRAHGAAAHDWVLVHDAARCLVQPAWIDRLIDACLDDAVGGLLALPVPDTVKAAAPGDRVARTVDRNGLWAAQTPQMFRIGALSDALDRAAASGVVVTDEASAMESTGVAPRLVQGALLNFKLTWPDDFELAARLLAAEAAPASA